MTTQGIIDPDSLDFMRETVDGLNHNMMPDHCTIWRASTVVDPAGGYELVYAQVAEMTDIPCRFDHLSTRYRDEKPRGMDEIISMPEIVITIPFEYELLADDRIEVEGKKYEIERTLQLHSWRTVHRYHVRGINV